MFSFFVASRLDFSNHGLIFFVSGSPEIFTIVLSAKVIDKYMGLTYEMQKVTV